MTRWAMLADLERCVGCQTCVAACRHANATSPAVQWRKVLDVEAGSFPDVKRVFVPVGCQHCADPPCMHVCPTTATRQRADGIVTIDYELCIGCAYCEVACPYQARFLVDMPGSAYAAPMPNEVEREEPARRAVAQKCNFCSERIDFGLEHGLTPGLDPEATPACVNACIADALIFGDLDDPDSNVSRLLDGQKHFRMHEELGTDPSFRYLYAKQDDTDGETGGEWPPGGERAGKVRARGVEPWHQPHWNWKAAGNFLCGGAGTGLLAAAALAGLAGAPVAALSLVALAGLGLVALGLFLLLFKIGRPLRSLYVLRQPQRSWMAREAWVAAALFPLALIALWLGDGALIAAAAAVGLIFLYCQAMILKEAKGIPAWREPRIIPLIVATGLAEGCGLFLVAAVLLSALAAMAGPAAAALVLLAAARAAIWLGYAAALERKGVPARTAEILKPFRGWFLAFGLALPLVAIILSLAAASLAAPLLALAGLSAVAAGWALKFILVTRAAFNQGFALARTPVRGAGAPGPAVKPGWSLP